ncbi:MAG: hypothetical protein ACT4QC_04745 [Planctomycetaceae bacterium]
MGTLARVIESRTAAVELVLLLLLVGLFAAARPLVTKRFCIRSPSRRKTAVICVGVLATLISSGFAVRRPPAPAVHDEFGNLLIADTFLEGRLANSTHPMWPHFETFYVLQKPNYASMYPPAQGGLLALGRALVGHPVGGICLGMGVAAASVCWMLQGWLPSRWAFLGGLMTACHSSLQVGWFNYWGGIPAMIGGSLMFGAWGRHLKGPTISTSVLLAVGVVLLAFSRPFEGLVASIPVACSVFFSTVASRNGSPIAAVFLPAGLILLLGASALARYNFAITGSPTRLPATLWSRQYSPRPIFLWQTKRPAPDVQHQALRDFGNRRSEWEEQQSLGGVWSIKAGQLRRIWEFYLQAILTMPLLMLPWIARSARIRKVIPVLLLLFAMSLTVAWLFPHYWSLVFSLILLVVLQGMRHWHITTRNSAHVVLKYVLPSILCTFFLIHLTLMGLHAYSPRVSHFGASREKVLSQLAALGGRHLVIVRYSPTHPYHHEWVYNAADIDASSVVWARDMGSHNAGLLEYFNNRRVWLLEADNSQPLLEPYQDLATLNK